jgi:pyridoxal phosphate enzyme (YggS family)
MSLIADNLARIKAQIGKASVIAVSKRRSVDEIVTAIEAGQKVFGENYVQEAAQKFPVLRARYPDLVLHLIGALQSNKAQDAVDLFDVIQTVDRVSLADALAKAMAKTGKRPDLYIQVNIGDEPQKAGVALGEVESFLAYCQSIGLEISGLMCIPPQDKEPRIFFTAMREMAGKLGLPHVSMGMSEDYPVAIECGATEIRVGTAIFGKRE